MLAKLLRSTLRAREAGASAGRVNWAARERERKDNNSDKAPAAELEESWWHGLDDEVLLIAKHEAEQGRHHLERAGRWRGSAPGANPPPPSSLSLQLTPSQPSTEREGGGGAVKVALLLLSFQTP
jgi:hypothetical protein